MVSFTQWRLLMDATQPLLFVGKKAKHFFSHVEDVAELGQKRTTVFWGGLPFVSFLEKDQRDVRNTLAVSLAQAGMSQTDVAKVLGLSRRQLCRYLHEGTSPTAGPGRPVLADEKVCKFVREEYQRIRAQGQGRWRQEVGESVRKKFGVVLKAPTLSAIVAPLSKSSSGKSNSRAESQKEKPSVGASEDLDSSADAAEREKEVTDSGSVSEGKGEAASSDCVLEEAEKKNGESSGESVAAGLVDATPVAEPVRVPFDPPKDPTQHLESQRLPASISSNGTHLSLSPQKELEERLKGEGIYSRYAGGFLLNPFIARMFEGVLDRERHLKCATQFNLESYILTFVQMNQFGCNNYEEVLELHPDEFGPLAGLSRSPSLNTLYRITPEFLQVAEPMEFGSRIALNYTNCLAIASRLFYLDGHFQRYFGKQEMLTGFHPQSDQYQKGYFQTCLSTECGSPLLLIDSDSLLTFQDCIRILVKQLLSLLGQEAVPWMVFDRGGYDRELMALFAGQKARQGQFAAHYIAWEQYDNTDYASMELDWQDIVLEAQGNDPEHPKELKLKIAEAPEEVRQGIWAKGSPASHQRKIILRRDYTRKGRPRTLCSPFCTSDWETDASLLAASLTKRWRQENGFKIIDGDYGFDCISTYKTDHFTPAILDDLPGQMGKTVSARESRNPELRRLDKERDHIRAGLGRITERLEKLEKGEKIRADRSKYKLPKDKDGLLERRKEYMDQLNEIEVRRSHLPQKINRFDHLTGLGCARLDFSKKWMLDILRASANNIRRMALDTWMNHYSNWRDYTQRFRDLLQVGGHLRLKGNTLHIELKPMSQPRYQRAAEAFVERIAKLQPLTFGIGPYRIKFTFKM